jgi:hypothetical protein
MPAILNKKLVNKQINLKVIIKTKNLVDINRIIIINITKDTEVINYIIMLEVCSKINNLHNFFLINKIYRIQIHKSYNLSFCQYCPILALIYFKLLVLLRINLMTRTLVYQHYCKN